METRSGQVLFRERGRRKSFTEIHFPHRSVFTHSKRAHMPGIAPSAALSAMAANEGACFFKSHARNVAERTLVVFVLKGEQKVHAGNVPRRAERHFSLLMRSHCSLFPHWRSRHAGKARHLSCLLRTASSKPRPGSSGGGVRPGPSRRTNQNSRKL